MESASVPMSVLMFGVLIFDHSATLLLNSEEWSLTVCRCVVCKVRIEASATCGSCRVRTKWFTEFEVGLLSYICDDRKSFPAGLLPGVSILAYSGEYNLVSFMARELCFPLMRIGSVGCSKDGRKQSHASARVLVQPNVSAVKNMIAAPREVICLVLLDSRSLVAAIFLSSLLSFAFRIGSRLDTPCL